MPRLIDNTQSQAIAETIVQRMRERRIIWVPAFAGAGRTRVMDALSARFPEALAVDAPGLEHPDAPLHALLQAAAPLGPTAIAGAFENHRDIQDRARTVGKALAEAGHLLLMRLPDSWGLAQSGDKPDRERFQERSHELLRGLLKVPGLRVVLLTGARTRTLAHFLDLDDAEKLLPIQAKLRKGALDDIQGWGTYDRAAARVREALSIHFGKGPSISPLHVRLLVGLVALGDPLEEVLAGSVQGTSSVFHLERLLKRLDLRLDQPENAALRQGVYRLAQARYPLPERVALSLADVDKQNAPLFTECLAYGDSALRMPEFMRRHFLGRLGTRTDATLHDRLAKHYQSRDGVTNPLGLQVETVIPWLEKVHHLAHSGSAGAAQWSAQMLPAREFYWDRARALSIEQRDHLTAAFLYRECISRFGTDDYSCHYYAYNLDRAGVQPEDIEWGYRQAVSRASDNPWWNSRLVTFLISQARFREAEQEWSDALERVDPDQVLIWEDARLARSFHRWVVRAWLDNGEVARARRVFDEIPREVTDKDEDLLALAWRLNDAEEAESLGESVYPAGVPMGERWRLHPAIPPVTVDGSPLQGWFPGRILDADEEQVTVVIATPDWDARERRVLRVSLLAKEWTQYGGWGPLPGVSGFFILARYQNGEARLVPQVVPLPPWGLEGKQADPHLRTWARG